LAPAKRKPERQRLLVVAALVENRGRVLFSQRRADQSFPRAWEFPGGKVESGESPTEALTREIREELGCTIRVGEVAEVVYHAYPEFDLVMLVYRAGIVAGTPRPVEVEAVAWVPRRQIAKLTLPPADLPLARKLARQTKIRVRAKLTLRAGDHRRRGLPPEPE
jgi:8-oxo-dGTP diphosphatase